MPNDTASKNGAATGQIFPNISLARCPYCLSTPTCQLTHVSQNPVPESYSQRVGVSITMSCPGSNSPSQMRYGGTRGMVFKGPARCAGSAGNLSFVLIPPLFEAEPTGMRP